MNKEYKNPGTTPPKRVYECIGCGRLHTIHGAWNNYTGRWLMSFDCANCGTHQETFVSEPRGYKQEERSGRNPYKD